MLTMSPTELFSKVIHEWTEVYMHRSMRDFKRFMEETGLSFSHVNILMRLFHGGISGVSEVGEQLGITNAAASQTVDRLVQMGLIQRTEDPQDRRAKCLELTSEGRALVEKGINVRSKWIENLTDNLNAEEQEMITSALILLTEAVHKDQE
jgi:DNA-binding MarR family transcriptional regulator